MIMNVLTATQEAGNSVATVAQWSKALVVHMKQPLTEAMRTKLQKEFSHLRSAPNHRADWLETSTGKSTARNENMQTCNSTSNPQHKVECLRQLPADFLLVPAWTVDEHLQRQPLYNCVQQLAGSLNVCCRRFGSDKLR